MLLLQLPPEILRLIFENIDPTFFQGNVNHLTICRRWYEFALAQCLKRIMLHGYTLRRALDAGTLKQPSALFNCCEALSLNLGGDQTYPPSLTSEAASMDEMSEANALVGRQTLDDLVQLARLTHGCRKLRTLDIHASCPPPHSSFGSQRDYLSLPTMRSLLSADTLAVLVLDLSVGFWDSLEYQEAGCELCPTIGALLGSLRVLQLRTRTICPNALKPRTDSNVLSLTKLLVNLSLATNSSWRTSATHARRCGFSGGGILELRADMQTQAESLVPRMKTPRMLRILTHSLPAIETRAVDILTGKTLVLDGGMAWDQDGRIVEEHSESESELSEDALAAFLNSDDEAIE